MTDKKESGVHCKRTGHRRQKPDGQSVKTTACSGNGRRKSLIYYASGDLQHKANADGQQRLVFPPAENRTQQTGQHQPKCGGPPGSGALGDRERPRRAGQFRWNG